MRQAVPGRRRFVLGALAGALTLAGCGTVREAGGEAASPDGGPTTAELMESGELGDIAFGSEDAPVTMIEYGSLTCPYCRQYHKETFPKLKSAYIDTGKLRYIVREFPIGRAAATAAMVTRCAGDDDNDAYLTLHREFLDRQSQWVSQEVRHDAIFGVAERTGLSRSEFDNCLANQRIIDGLTWVKERGREFGVVGTPTFFVNGEMESGALSLEEVETMIEPYIS